MVLGEGLVSKGNAKGNAKGIAKGNAKGKQRGMQALRCDPFCGAIHCGAIYCSPHLFSVVSHDRGRGGLLFPRPIQSLRLFLSLFYLIIPSCCCWLCVKYAYVFIVGSYGELLKFDCPAQKSGQKQICNPRAFLSNLHKPQSSR